MIFGRIWILAVLVVCCFSQSATKDETSITDEEDKSASFTDTTQSTLKTSTPPLESSAADSKTTSKTATSTTKGHTDPPKQSSVSEEETESGSFTDTPENTLKESTSPEQSSARDSRTTRETKTNTSSGETDLPNQSSVSDEETGSGSFPDTPESTLQESTSQEQSSARDSKTTSKATTNSTNGETEQSSVSDEETGSGTFSDATDTTLTNSSVAEVSSASDINTTPKITSSDHDIEIIGTSPSSHEKENITNNSSFTDEDITISTIPETTTQQEDVTSICFLNPCRNGGTCAEDVDVKSLFSCACPDGFAGIRCGTVDKCVVDQEGQICKSGACQYSKDGLERSCECFSGMYWDGADKKCRDPEPPCFPNPCMNGGICSSDDGHCDCPTGYTEQNCSILNKCGDKCTNGTCVLDKTRTVKYCKCDEGFFWHEEKHVCSVMTSPCDSSPCLNGAVCEATSDSEYNCTCTNGSSGANCEFTELCSGDGDCGLGTCDWFTSRILEEGKVIEAQKTRKCKCNDGAYLEETSHTCKEITNKCQPNPCLNDGICIVESASEYNCTCSPGFSGKNCDVRDMCKMDGGDAYCTGGICQNNHKLGIYFCVCEEGQYFQYAARKCTELDICPLVHCEKNERCAKGECECAENYLWNNSSKKCDPDFCSSNPCPVSKMLCLEGTGSTDYRCYCPEGSTFNGTHCNDVQCTFPSLNPCSQLCSATEDGYTCGCVEDFELAADNSTCTYIGNDTCTNKTCAHGFCVEKDEKEVCICPPGFVEKDGTCKDLCTAKQLSPGICPSNECEVSEESGFRCKCEGKLALSKDKTTCMVRNVCEEHEIGWKTCAEQNAYCTADWMATNGFKCKCAKGQVPTEGGVCKNKCSIENNQRMCSIDGATCDPNIDGTRFCKCPPYFQINERNRKCTQPADFSYLITLPLDKSTYLASNRQRRSLDPQVDYRKMSADLSDTMEDMFRSFTEANILSCEVTSDCILCKIELQFATDSEEDLKRLQTKDVCLSHGNSNACLLRPSLVLNKNKIPVNVKIKPTDPCDEDIKHVVCGSETTCTSSVAQKSFNCSCKPGFSARRKSYPFGNTRTFIEICTDIDECLLGDPCPANSMCSNTIGSFACSCKSGFRDAKEQSGGQKCVELCNPSPCTHGVCSSRGEHEFDCRCDAGYSGALCDLQDQNFKRAKTNTIIVGVVLGGFLLITFILFAVCVSRLRKTKDLENPGHMFYGSTEMTERRRVEGGVVNNVFQRE